MSSQLGEGEDSFPGRTWRAPVVPSGSQCRPPTGSSQHPALHSCDILQAAGCAPCPSSDELLPGRGRMETAPRVDKHPCAEHHGCRERPSACASSWKPRIDDAAAAGSQERRDEDDTHVCIHSCVCSSRMLSSIPRRKCDALEAQLAELRMSAQGLVSPTATAAPQAGGQASSPMQVRCFSVCVTVYFVNAYPTP